MPQTAPMKHQRFIKDLKEAGLVLSKEDGENINSEIESIAREYETGQIKRQKDIKDAIKAAKEAKERSHAKAISTVAGTCHAIVLDAGHYSRPWHGRILVLPTEMQPDCEMAHSLCHAFSPKVACYFHVGRSG